MNIHDAFPSRYVKAAQLDKPRLVTIAEFRVEDVSGHNEPTEPRPILIFRDSDETPGLVLNRTNSDVIAELFGDETDGWLGKSIELYKARTDFRGRMVDCVRVRAPEVPPVSQSVPQVNSVPTDWEQTIGSMPGVAQMQCDLLRNGGATYGGFLSWVTWAQGKSQIDQEQAKTLTAYADHVKEQQDG